MSCWGYPEQRCGTHPTRKNHGGRVSEKNGLGNYGKDFFDKIANEMFYDKESRVKPADKLARALTDLFERRNKIAHQADRNHQTGDLYDINRQDVENAIGVVETFVTTVHKLLTE